MDKPEYRFEWRIVDQTSGATAANGSTYLVPERINGFGECESVDGDVASGLRAFRSTGRQVHEDIHYPKEDDND